MASLTRWMWVWVNSGSWWWTGRPGVLRFMGSQRIGHDWATKLNWNKIWSCWTYSQALCVASSCVILLQPSLFVQLYLWDPSILTCMALIIFSDYKASHCVSTSQFVYSFSSLRAFSLLVMFLFCFCTQCCYECPCTASLCPGARVFPAYQSKGGMVRSYDMYTLTFLNSIRLSKTAALIHTTSNSGWVPLLCILVLQIKNFMQSWWMWNGICGFNLPFPNYWCSWTVVLEKILESPLDSKEIKPVNPKGNQP